MNIGDFLHSKRWKLMQNYIYSWGASVVLIGALFKLEHLPGASVFLGVGLSIEAIIFFVSAFEPMMEVPDWKVVYPQLRTGDESERDLKKYEKADKLMHGQPVKGSVAVSGSTGANASISMGGLSEAQISSLKESFEKLSQTASGLKDISNAVSATDGFVKNLNEASESVGSVASANKIASAAMMDSVGQIGEAYKYSAQVIKDSSSKAASGIESTIGQISTIVTDTANDIKNSANQSTSTMQKSVADLGASISKTSQSIDETAKEFGKKLNQSADELSTSHKEMTTSLANGYKGLEKSADKYVNGLEKLNKNLAAINTAYELHLKGASKVETMVNEYSKGVGEIGNLLNTSIEETKKFNQNTKAINDNILALNNIYGRMLGALNGKK